MQNTTIKPNLQSRASVMAAAGRVQLAVTDNNGETIYVKFEAKLKDGPSGKRYEAVMLEHATHVFISEKGYGTPSYGSYYPPKSAKFPAGRLFPRDGIEPMFIRATEIAIEYINSGDLPVGYTIEAEDNCGLCGRKLTDPVSIQRGIGPECASKPTGTKILHASAFAPTPKSLVDEATDLIFAKFQLVEQAKQDLEQAEVEYAQAVEALESMKEAAAR